MAAVTSPSNTNAERLDGVVLTSGPTALLKRAVNSRSVTGGDVNAADQGVATHVDDAAFTPATDSVVTFAAFADETSPDSVDEGDTGAVRMTLDRILRVVSQQRSSTPTITSVAAGTAVGGTVLAANTARLGATVTNGGTALMYLALGTAASSTRYTATLAGSSGGVAAYYEVPYGYTGIITGSWTAANGSAFVTELTA